MRRCFVAAANYIHIRHTSRAQHPETIGAFRRKIYVATPAQWRSAYKEHFLLLYEFCVLNLDTIVKLTHKSYNKGALQNAKSELKITNCNASYCINL